MLPTTLVRRVADLPRLADEIQGLLQDYAYDEQALVGYVAATLRHSTRCNLYSGLLGREGVYAPEAGSAGREANHERERLNRARIRRLLEHPKFALKEEAHGGTRGSPVQASEAKPLHVKRPGDPAPASRRCPSP
jgi:hypothetical protein